MRNLLPSLLVAAALAVPVPAVAQPLEVYVPYTAPPRGYDPSVFLPRFQYPHYQIYGNPYDLGNFDPAAAAINAELAIHPRTRQIQLDPELFSTLARTGENATEHFLRCQARYPSYDLASDTWLDNGLPRRCRY